MKQFPGSTLVTSLFDANTCADLCDMGRIGSLFLPENLHQTAAGHTLDTLITATNTLIVDTCLRDHHRDKRSPVLCPKKTTNLVCGHSCLVRDTSRKFDPVTHRELRLRELPHHVTAFSVLAADLAALASTGRDVYVSMKQMNALSTELFNMDGGAEHAYRLVQGQDYDEECSEVRPYMIRSDWSTSSSLTELQRRIAAAEEAIGEQVKIFRDGIARQVMDMVLPELVQRSFESATAH